MGLRKTTSSFLCYWNYVLFIKLSLRTFIITPESGNQRPIILQKPSVASVSSFQWSIRDQKALKIFNWFVEKSICLPSQVHNGNYKDLIPTSDTIEHSTFKANELVFTKINQYFMSPR